MLQLPSDFNSNKLAGAEKIVNNVINRTGTNFNVPISVALRSS